MGVAGVAVAACGPVVATDEVTATDGTGSETDPSTGSCERDEDCPDQYYCDEGMCRSEYVADEGPYYDEGCYAECCYDDGCDYDECYSDDDCGVAGLCDQASGDGVCVEVPAISECEGTELIPIAALEVGDVVSLSFVDANGDGAADLAIGRAAGADLLLGPVDEATTPLPVGSEPVVGVASGRFDGDAIDDLVVAQGGQLTVLAGDGMGGFTIASTSMTPVGAIARIAPLGFSGPDAHDVAVFGADGNAQVYAGELLQAATPFLDPDPSVDMAVGDFDLDGLDDVALEGGTTTWVYRGNPALDVDPGFTIGADAGDVHGIVAGAFGGTGPSMLLRHRTIAGTWTLLDGGNALTMLAPQALVAVGAGSEAGDLDGDGRADLVLFEGRNVTIALTNRAAEGLFACSMTVELTSSVSAVAVGDRDGDGRSELAVADGLTVSIFALP